MKSKYLSLALLAFLFTACNNTPMSEAEATPPVDESKQVTEPAPMGESSDYSTQESATPAQDPAE